MTTGPEPFMWDGRALSTMEDIYNEAVRIAQLEAPLMAAEFIDDYGTYIERTNPEVEDGRHIAMQNLGYYAGYHDSLSRQKMYEVFEIGYMDDKWKNYMKENRPFP